MDDDTFFELGLGIVIILTILNYLFSGTAFYASVLTMVAFFGVLMFIKGAIELVIGRGTQSLMIGVTVCMVLIILFNGLPVVMSIFDMILGIAG